MTLEQAEAYIQMGLFICLQSLAANGITNSEVAKAIGRIMSTSPYSKDVNADDEKHLEVLAAKIKEAALECMQAVNTARGLVTLQ